MKSLYCRHQARCDALTSISSRRRPAPCSGWRGRRLHHLLPAAANLSSCWCSMQGEMSGADRLAKLDAEQAPLLAAAPKRALQRQGSSRKVRCAHRRLPCCSGGQPTCMHSAVRCTAAQLSVHEALLLLSSQRGGSAGPDGPDEGSSSEHEEDAEAVAAAKVRHAPACMPACSFSRHVILTLHWCTSCLIGVTTTVVLRTCSGRQWRLSSGSSRWRGRCSRSTTRYMVEDVSLSTGPTHQTSIPQTCRTQCLLGAQLPPDTGLRAECFISYDRCWHLTTSTAISSSRHRCPRPRLNTTNSSSTPSASRTLGAQHTIVLQ